MRFSREPAEHDANSSYSSYADGVPTPTGRLPKESDLVNSFVLRLPPGESFEVSDGDIE